MRRFPEIVEPSRDGRLRITSVVEVAKVLTAENRHEGLPKFFQRSRRDAMALAAALQPSAAPHRDVITAAGVTSRPLRESARRVTGSDAAVQPVEPGAAVQPVEPDGVEDPATQTGCVGMNAPSAAISRASDSAEPLTADLSRVEYDHIIPRAMGGSSRPGNLRLLCRLHDDLAARRAFGADWMNQFTHDPASPKRPAGS